MIILEEYESDKSSCRKVGVKKSRILVDFKRVEVYVVEYAPSQCLAPEETIEKASKHSDFIFLELIQQIF